MRIVFFGTPAFAVPSLEALLDLGETVVAVVTQPDRPRGRSRSTLVAPEVKTRALAAGIPVLQPERPIGDDFLAALRAVRPDLGVVVAYGHILRPSVLGTPPLGMINVHASLLPAWRGAAPIQWSIAHGDAVTGVTIMRMEAGLDSGPILLAKTTPITAEETGGTLTARLARLGAEALTEAILQLRAGSVRETPQDHARATLAPKIGRAVARIDWTRPAPEVAARIRGFDPIPGAWSAVGATEIKLFRPTTARAEGPGSPGLVLATSPALLVSAGTGAVQIGEVQPAGRPRLSTIDWIRGRPIAPGDRFQ
ncbi:MAG: methionyl-tRNA formyltransferase [Gemmatimonadales bacterium]